MTTYGIIYRLSADEEWQTIRLDNYKAYAAVCGLLRKIPGAEFRCEQYAS